MSRFTLDPDTGMAYVQFAHEPVARTIEVTNLVNLDLSESGTVVGLEIFGHSVDFPFEKLVNEFQLKEDQIALIKRVLPSI